MTKREAIRECKRLWKEIGKFGKDKDDFLESPAGEKWLDKDYQNDCPLCEYARGKGCEFCPLYTQYDKGCYELNFEANPPTQFIKAVMGLKE